MASQTALDAMYRNLMLSARVGDAEKGGVDIGKSNHLIHQTEERFNRSPLQIAILNGNFNWLKEMFERVNITPDPPIEHDESGEIIPPKKPTSLNLALAWKNTEIIRILLEYGCNLEIEPEIWAETSPNMQKLVELAKEDKLVPIYKIDNKAKKKKK